MEPVPSSSQVSVVEQKHYIEPKVRINTAFSLNTLYKVFQTFDSEKRGLVHSIGLGGLLKCHNQRLQCRDLIYSLLSRMDPISGSIVLSNGVLTVSDKDVHLVLGTQYKGVEVKVGTRPPLVLAKVKMALLLGPDAELNMDVVIGIILKDYGRKMSPTEREAFKVATIIFADACFLGPRGDKRKINKEILQLVADGISISDLNLSGYVLTVLRQSAGKVQQSSRCVQKSVFLEGCLFFLLVFYLDNLSAGFLTPPHDCFPRVAKYTPSLVSELVSYDRRRKMPHSIIEFGRAQLRPSDEVVYSRNSRTCSKQSVYRTGPDASVVSTSKVISTGSSQSCSILDLDMSKMTSNVEFSEAQYAFEEYIKIFKGQVAQATDELQLKVHTLLGCSRSYGRPRSRAATGSKEDTLFDDELLSISPICLGADTKSITGCRILGNQADVSLPASSSLRPINADFEELHGQLASRSPELLTSFIDRLEASSLDGVQESCVDAMRSWVLFDESDSLCNSGDISSCSHSIFGSTTFDLELKDKDFQFRAIMEVIRLLPRFSIDDKQKCWYSHSVPKFIEIDGHSLYSAFYSDVDFSTDIMDAVMRLYHELDDKFYQVCQEKRWRHYLPATWAEIALLEENSSELSLLKNMMNGGHINYSVGDCQLVLLPVRLLGEWALYVWDFGMKQITILDPVVLDFELLNRKHKTVASMLHNALMICRQDIFGQIEPSTSKWRLKYMEATDNYPSNKSGLYTVFYSRYFDGQTVIRSMIVEDSVTLYQTNLLCQLLGSPGNHATCPVEISSAIFESI